MAEATESLTITPQVDRNLLAKIQADAAKELKALSPLIIEDDETAQVIAQELAQELGRLDQIEAMKKQANGPIAQLKKTIDSWFKPGKDQCELLVGMYKTALSNYRQKQLAAQEEALRVAALASRTGDLPALTQALTTVNAGMAQPAGVSFPETWEPLIINPGLVPYEYLTPDIEKIKAYGKSFKGGATPGPIGGVQWQKKVGVRSSHGA
jgi:hypothetical protein